MKIVFGREQELLNQIVKLENEKALMELKHRSDVALINTESSRDRMVKEAAYSSDISITQAKSESEITKRDAIHAAELAKLNILITNAKAEKDNAVEAVKGQLIEEYKKSIIDLSEEVAINRTKAEEKELQNKLILEENKRLVTEFNKIQATITEMAKAKAEIIIVKPEIAITPGATVQVLPIPTGSTTPTTVVNK